MINNIQKKIYRLATYIETFFAAIIHIVIVVLAIKLIMGALVPGYFDQANAFNEFLQNALALVVGVEFVKMLVKHTPDNVVEVLIFAISRHLIVYHLEMWEMLIGILCIAILFAIRRFLFIPFHHEGENGKIIEEELSE